MDVPQPDTRFLGQGFGAQQKPANAPRPSRIPTFGRGGGAKRKNRSSVVDVAEAIKIVGVLKQEVQKVGCVLRTWFVRHHARGIDVEKINIFCSDQASLTKLVKSMDPDGLLDHKRRNRTTSMALAVVSKKVKDRLKEELNLEGQLFDFSDIDVGLMSVTTPVAGEDGFESPDLEMPEPMGEPIDMSDLGDDELPGEDVYEPEDAEMDLESEGMPGEGAEVLGASAPFPGADDEEGLPGEVTPEDEIGRARQVPELI